MMVRFSRAAMTLGLVFLLAACGGAAATATPPPTNTPVPPTATAVPPTATPVPPTATPTNTPVPPTATPTKSNTPVPPTATAVPPTATRPAATATTARASTAPTTGGKVLTDTTKACQVTLPATFTGDNDGSATSNDQNAFLNLQAFPVQPLGLEATITLFVDGFKGSIVDYKETNRQSGTDRGRPYTVVTYTGTLASEPVVGQFYFVQESSSICTMSFIVKQKVSSQYGDIVGSLADSLQAVKP